MCKKIIHPVTSLTFSLALQPVIGDETNEEYWVSTPEIETVSIIIDLLSPKQVWNTYSNINYVLSSDILSVSLLNILLTFLVERLVFSLWRPCIGTVAGMLAWLQTAEDP